MQIKSKYSKDMYVLQTLVGRDFKLKYRRSVIGVLWSILNPLLMMVVLSAVFSFFLRFGSIENFPLYLILGMTLFNFMSGATSSAMSSIIDASSLIKKVRVNKILFPLQKVTFELTNFATSLVAVAIVMIFFKITPTINLLLLPILLIYIFMFTLGISLALSALSVFFRDIMHLWGVILTAWTYATPIFYPVDILEPWMQNIMSFNPMFHYITYYRDIALWGNTPSIETNLLCACIGIVSMVIGLAIFKKTQNKFILYT